MKSRAFPKFDLIVATRNPELGPNTVHDSKVLLFRKKVRKWLEKNCSGQFLILGASVGFENEWDAIAFKMFSGDGKAWDYTNTDSKRRSSFNIWTGASIKYGTEFPVDCHIHFERSLFPKDYLDKYVGLFVDLIAGEIYWPRGEDNQRKCSPRGGPLIPLAFELPEAWVSGQFLVTVGTDNDHVIKVYDRCHTFPKHLSRMCKDD